MRHFKIKVCGLTRPRDAETAAGLGADLAGMIFYRRSPRFVSLIKAASIVKALPPTVHRVGVFVDDPVDRIVSVVTRLELDFVQLHRPCRSSDLKRIRGAGARIIRVAHIEKKRDYLKILRNKTDLVMLDNRSAERPGGTGVPFDWSLQPPRRIPNLVLAGGINRDNLSEGLRIFEPLVIDVNSGVESRPGIKSKTRLTDFFETANRLRYGR